MEVRLVKTAAELQDLRGPWSELCGGLAEESSPFDSFEWYETWWRHYSAGAKLNVITMWDGAKLAGVAPLMLKRVTIHGLPAKALCFIKNNHSLNSDFIVLPAYREQFLREVLQRCFLQGIDWDLLVLKDIPVDSPNMRALAALLDQSGRKWQQTWTPHDSPFLVPAPGWTDYLSSRTTRTRKSLRNICNSLEKRGEVTVRLVRSWEDFLAVKDQVFEVARLSWAGTDGDQLTSIESEEFWEELARVAAQKGWLALWTLQLNGRIIAIEFHLRASGREYAMRGHYLPEFANLSPGTYLEMQILKHVHEEPDRLRVYDFCGSFENYKRKWTDSFVGHDDLTVFGRSMYSRLLALHETVAVPLLRRALPQEFWNNRFFRMVGINTNRMGS